MKNYSQLAFVARKTFIFWLLFLLPWTAANAGVFSVSPVRLYMATRDRAIAVTLTNEGDTSVALQADINSWSQKPDGSDELVLTEDLILSPPIIKLGPKERQVVRLARLLPPDASRQLSYRLIVREVTEIMPSAGIQVPILLAFSLPVFITPPAAKRQVDCSTERAGSSALNLLCSNSGSAYAQIRQAVVQRGDQVLASFEGGSYILSGASKTISLKGENPFAQGPAQLLITFDDGKNLSTPITLP